MTNQFAHSYYHDLTVQPALRSKAISEAVAFLRRHGIRFDSVAVRGMSGAILGSALASRMRKPITFVRKGNEDSHSPAIVEGIRCDRYLIVDDFVSSGKTALTIAFGIRGWNPNAEFVGVLQLDKFAGREGRDGISLKGIPLELLTEDACYIHE